MLSLTQERTFEQSFPNIPYNNDLTHIVKSRCARPDSLLAAHHLKPTWNRNAVHAAKPSPPNSLFPFITPLTAAIAQPAVLSNGSRTAACIRSAASPADGECQSLTAFKGENLQNQSSWPFQGGKAALRWDGQQAGSWSRGHCWAASVKEEKAAGT